MSEKLIKEIEDDDDEEEEEIDASDALVDSVANEIDWDGELSIIRNIILILFSSLEPARTNGYQQFHSTSEQRTSAEGQTQRTSLASGAFCSRNFYSLSFSCPWQYSEYKYLTTLFSLDPVPTISENELTEKLIEKKRQPFVTDETLCLEKTAYVG